MEHQFALYGPHQAVRSCCRNFELEEISFTKSFNLRRMKLEKSRKADCTRYRRGGTSV
jgi:hypothetical protein